MKAIRRLWLRFCLSSLDSEQKLLDTMLADNTIKLAEIKKFHITETVRLSMRRNAIRARLFRMGGID